MNDEPTPGGGSVAASAAAREALYLAHAGYLITVAMRSFGLDREAARDVVQEVFCRVVESGPRRITRAWLRTALEWSCRRHVQRLAHRPEEVPIEKAEFRREASFDPRDGLVRNQMLDSAVGRLRPSYQRVITLHFLEGRTAPEIASELGRSTGYIERLIHDAKLELGRILKGLKKKR